MLPASVRVAVNGIPENAEELRTRYAYVQQDDLFIAALTTRNIEAILRMAET
ncbi:hypothetical protein quinque_005501, partial [Culex quinquefasciatus]